MTLDDNRMHIQNKNDKTPLLMDVIWNYSTSFTTKKDNVSLSD